MVSVRELWIEALRASCPAKSAEVAPAAKATSAKRRTETVFMGIDGFKGPGYSGPRRKGRADYTKCPPPRVLDVGLIRSGGNRAPRCPSPPLVERQLDQPVI